VNYKVRFKITNHDQDDAGHPNAQNASWEEEIQCDCKDIDEAYETAYAILLLRYPNMHIECLNRIEAPIQSQNRPANVFDPASLKGKTTIRRKRNE
jgi:hypothetical protein